MSLKGYHMYYQVQLAPFIYVLAGKVTETCEHQCCRINYVATWKTFYTILYARFMYWFEVMIVYPTRNMCG